MRWKYNALQKHVWERGCKNPFVSDLPSSLKNAHHVKCLHIRLSRADLFFFFSFFLCHLFLVCRVILWSDLHVSDVWSTLDSVGLRTFVSPSNTLWVFNPPSFYTFELVLSWTLPGAIAAIVFEVRMWWIGNMELSKLVSALNTVSPVCR